CVRPLYGVGAVWVHRLPCASHLPALLRAIRSAPTDQVYSTPCIHDVPHRPMAYTQRDGHRPVRVSFLTYPRGRPVNDGRSSSFASHVKRVGWILLEGKRNFVEEIKNAVSFAVSPANPGRAAYAFAVGIGM